MNPSGTAFAVWPSAKIRKLNSGRGRDSPSFRYFPNLVIALGGLKSKMFVLYGEICVPAQSGFPFDALLQHIHSTASRVQGLASKTPAGNADLARKEGGSPPEITDWN
jgi:hypothetical protein